MLNLFKHIAGKKKDIYSVPCKVLEQQGHDCIFWVVFGFFLLHTEDVWV